MGVSENYRTFVPKYQFQAYPKMEALKSYPVGIQTFSEIINRNLLYVDKTEYIYRMTHSGGKHFFLSRPRRFGKSLLTSTFQSYFEGKKELFKGLAIEKLEKDWMEYPVLHFDLSGGKHLEEEELHRYLHFILKNNEERFGIVDDSPDPNIRLNSLIDTLYKKTGKQVVVLIDEYDAPLLDVIHDKTKLEKLRYTMRNFFSPLKKCEPYLRFVFLTGITKFSQLSIFSELNNIRNVSLLPQYAGICGITKEELLTQMSADIDILGEKIGKTREETIIALKDYYDGYHFASESPDIFNPFSLLTAMENGMLDYYWFTSGTPTYLINMMKKFDTAYTDFAEGMEADASDFDAPTDADIMTTITPLLYQSGYITIKDYDKEYDSYFLGIPNKEVRLGLTKALIPYYVTRNTIATNNTVRNMARALNKEDMNLALQHLQTFLGTIPYCDNTDYEGHYQQMLFVIFTLLSAYMVDVEVRTPKGRVDMVLRSKTHLYLLELKLNQSSDAAMKQIDLKEYPKRFALCGLPIVKVGINFDMATHNITDWKISCTKMPYSKHDVEFIK